MEAFTLEKVPTRDYIELRKKIEAQHDRMEKLVTVFLRVSTKGADENLNDLLTKAQDAFSNLVIHVGKFKELTAYPDITNEGTTFSEETTEKIDVEYEEIEKLSTEIVRFYNQLIQSKPELKHALNEVAVDQGDLSADSTSEGGSENQAFEEFKDLPNQEAVHARSALDAQLEERGTGGISKGEIPGAILEQAADPVVAAQERYSKELDKTLEAAEHSYTRVVSKLAVVVEDPSDAETKYKISFGSVVLHYENLNLNDVPAEEIEADVYKVLSDMSKDKEFGLLNRDENEISATLQLRLEDVFNSKFGSDTNLTGVEFENFDKQLIENDEDNQDNNEVSINPEMVTVTDPAVPRAVVPQKPA
ncbi:hypothetical protein KC723_01520 [Candidatus Kaiserbacteria bacterium]|nr:hypothetical protein [Candidatus Kaiserbacteria bacterium]